MSGITYDEALEFLYRAYGSGTKVGLEGVRVILASKNNPQEKLSVIHVAGTNGKGSTCAFLQHILIAAGYKVGAFTSPHLHRYNERMTIGGGASSDLRFISDDDFARLVTDVAIASKKVGDPSFFEILTCAAFMFFAEEAVDIAVIETGIGGRLDSTNVIERPLLSVITAGGYDHQELLGDSLNEIAAEDAGIIKENCPVAVYPREELPVFQEVAHAKNSPLYYLGEDVEISDCDFSLEGTEFSVKTAYFSYQSLSILLLGAHQVQNAILAMLCAKVCKLADEPAVRRGLLSCTWPGRFELVSQRPYIVLDGAHNVDGARIFSEALKFYFPNSFIVLLVGISKHKDHQSILQYMTSEADTVICTCSEFKAMPANKLAACIKKPTLIEENNKKAFELAIKTAGKEGVVAVAGSLYLIGDIRSVCNDRF